MNPSALHTIAAATGLGLLAHMSCASAQAYPARAIRMVVPLAPGGGTDTNARIISQRLSEQLGVSIIIDNRPGGGSMLGTELVVKAAADGYTLLTAPPELSVNPSLQPRIAYDTLKDLAPIAQTASSQYALSTHPSMPVKTVKDLIALAKARPGQLTYGSSGVGSLNHLSGALLQTVTATTLVHVPFKGSGPSSIALMSGEIGFLFSSTTAAVAQVKAGKIRAIAVTGPERFAELPNVPTAIESGLPGFVITGWFGVLAPAATPRDIIDKLAAEIAKAVQHPTVRERFAAIGTLPAESSPAKFAAFLRAEIDKWSRVVKASGARPE